MRFIINPVKRERETRQRIKVELIETEKEQSSGSDEKCAWSMKCWCDSRPLAELEHRIDASGINLLQG